jgi:hypothetical protein
MLYPDELAIERCAMKLHRIFSLLLLILTATFFAASGYAEHTPLHAPMGQMKADPDAKKAFEEGKVVPDYTYYYIGSIGQPDSVIGITKPYTLRDAKVWSKVLDMSDKVLRGWLQAWKNDGHALGDMHGGVLLDPDGKKAGIWYSHFPGSAVRMPKPGMLEVFQPHPLIGNPPGQGG